MTDLTTAAVGDTSGDRHQLPPGIVINDVRAAYGRIEVLHGVNLVVPPGCVFLLLGPNGAGKSTLLKVINGRMRPSSGEVLIGDRPVGKRATEKLARGGLCAVRSRTAPLPSSRGLFHEEPSVRYYARSHGARLRACRRSS